MPAQQSSNLRIVGPNNDANPVVNENNQLMLTVVDANNQPVTSGVTFETDSPDIVSIAANGMVTGKLQGYATVTARIGSNSVSNFVVVARVGKSKGRKVPGDTKVDTNGAVYFSDPNTHIILKKASANADAVVFAGQSGVKGKKDDQGLNALFNGPVGIAVDNRAGGGIFIADSLNNVIRKVDFNNNVTTVIGTGSIGTMSGPTPFSQAVFNNPQGLAIDAGGNLYIADTGNHAIYLADFVKQEVRPLAGLPGTAGKADGQGTGAMFNRPISISVNVSKATLFNSGSNDVILVADSGNGRIRSITPAGLVATLGPIRNNAADPAINADINANAAGSEFEFSSPQSIGLDDLGNIYIVDKSGVKLITRSVNNTSQLVSLAQPNASFAQAASVVVQGNSTIVLDTNAASDSEAVKVVTVGAPQIASMSRDNDRLEGGAEVVITGKNFAPESLVVIGDTVVRDAVVESATRIRVPKVPPQSAPGNRTISVRTRGGVAQQSFAIRSKPFSELAANEITTVVGGVPFIGDSGRALAAGIDSPQGVTIDGAGNLYISDTGHNRVRVVDTAGVITTVAGNGASAFSGDNGSALSASLNVPTTVLLDRAGNILIADSRNNVVRRVDINTNIITTIAGNGINGFKGDNGPATAAQLSFPTGIALDNAGNLLIADSGNSRIRRVDAVTGIIKTVIGTGFAGFGGDGGPATTARIAFAEGLTVDAAGNIYVLDRLVNNRIRRVDAKTNIINTVVGNGDFKYNGDNVKATAAAVDPAGVAVDDKGNIFIADLANSRIRMVDAVTGIITTVVGTGTRAFSGDGGPANVASLAFPTVVTLDGFGNLIIADQFNQRIRRVERSTNIITTIAGSDLGFGDNGLATSATLSDPFGLVFDKAGNLIVADTEDGLIRKIDAITGIITTIAGNGQANSSGDGGPAVNASFLFPSGIVIDSVGNLFVSDRFGDRVRRIDTAGIITTIAGITPRGFSGDGGPAANAQLSGPIGIAIDKADNLYIADSENGRIRRIDKNGIITTVAGTGSFNSNGDGAAATKAAIGFPLAVAVDKDSNIIILDGLNLRLRRVDSRTGIISTIAGNGEDGFSGDGGPAINASFSLSFGISTDAVGNIYLIDSNNHRVRRITPDGIINTVVGDGRADYRGDGGPALAASLNSPKGITVDAAGNLYIAAGFNSSIRVVKSMNASSGSVTISNASFDKPLLNITGRGFGQSGAIVMVNNKDISALLVSQSDTLISLKGNKKKFNLKKGQNQVVVTAGGAISNTFTFNF